MGHANVSNLSVIFLRRLYAKGKISIREVAKLCVERGEVLNASEGNYDDEYMICFGLENVVDFLLSPQKLKNGDMCSVIEPVKMTPEQKKVFHEWRGVDGNCDDWDCGDDGESGQYGMLDSIQFRFVSKWRSQYPDIPVLKHISN